MDNLVKIHVFLPHLPCKSESAGNRFTPDHTQGKNTRNNLKLFQDYSRTALKITDVWKNIRSYTLKIKFNLGNSKMSV